MQSLLRNSLFKANLLSVSNQNANLFVAKRFYGDKVQAINLRKGDIILRKGKYYDIAKTLHVAPQQRSAIIQIEMNEIPKGTKVNDRLRSQELVEVVEAKNMKCTFLERREGRKLIFVTDEDDEEIEVPEDIVNTPYLDEDMECTVKIIEGKPLSVKIPVKVEVEVVSAADGIAKIKNGRTIKVPTYVVAGDTIVVKPEDDSFVERII